MIEIGSASIAYSLVIFLVCLLLLVLFFCEFGRNRGEMATNPDSTDTLVVVSTEYYQSKLLTRHEVPWPLHESSWTGKLKTSVIGNSKTKREIQNRNCPLQVMDGNESDISQPDKIYTRS